MIEYASLWLSQYTTSYDRALSDLTSKQLYALRSKEDSMSLQSTGEGPLCGEERRHPFAHGRNICHELAFAAEIRGQKSRTVLAQRSRRCHTGVAESYCMCFSRKYKLHHRLRTWFPKDLRYCGQCDKFTARKSNHNYRCVYSILPVLGLSTTNMTQVSTGNQSNVDINQRIGHTRLAQVDLAGKCGRSGKLDKQVRRFR